MKPFKHIIAIDPSGAYYEGKGTTGVCFFNCIEGRAQEFDTICARAYDSDVAYWDAHIGILEKFVKRSQNPCVVIEDYLAMSPLFFEKHRRHPLIRLCVSPSSAHHVCSSGIVI